MVFIGLVEANSSFSSHEMLTPLLNYNLSRILRDIYELVRSRTTLLNINGSRGELSYVSRKSGFA